MSGISISGRATDGLFAIMLCVAVHAEVVTDGSLGPPQALTGPVFGIPARLGQQRGGNLFHSFSHFNLGSRESAAFHGPDSVDNVISRITGGMASHIDGTLRCDIPDANLYLLNPAGLLFGPGVHLDVSGSVYLSTANRLRLGNNGVFDARNPPNSSLSAAAPAAFELMSGIIKTEGSVLAVSPGRDLSFHSSGLEAHDSEFRARGGTLTIDAHGGSVTLSDSTTGALALMTAPANLDADNGGRVVIRSGDFYVENARISARMTTETDTSPQGIEIHAQDTLKLSSGKISTHSMQGQAGGITLSARHIALRNGHQVISNSAGGAGGDIRVHADSVHIEQALLRTDGNRTAQAGNIVIHADDISLRNRGGVYAFSSGSGSAGNIELHAGTVSLSGQSRIEASSNAARGGNIGLQIARRLMVDSSTISAKSSGRESRDSGGNVTVQAPRFTILSDATVSAEANYGDGGRIQLDGDYRLSVDSRLDASSDQGKDGQVIVNSPLMDFSDSLLNPAPPPATTPRIARGCIERLGENRSVLKARPYDTLPPNPWVPREVQENDAPALAAFKRLLNTLQEADAGYLAGQRTARIVVRSKLPAAVAAAATLPETADSAMELLALTVLQDKLEQPQGRDAVLRKVRRIAETARRPRLWSWLYGQLGHTRQAVFFAQQANAPELRYLWQAQRGAELAAQGNIHAAAAAYRQAVTALQTVRPLLLSKLGWEVAEDSLRMGETYRQALDYALRHAQTLRGAARQTALAETVAMVEQYRQFEVENYFQDSCLSLLRDDNVFAHDLSVPVLYPLVFADRVVLVLRRPTHYELYTVDTGERVLKGLLTQWQRRRYDTATGRRLYEILIQPLDLDATQIETLVIVPDSSLYGMPFSALHDGREYLVQKSYATVISPALSLTASATQANPYKQALLAGLGKATGQLPPLRHTGRELEDSAARLAGYTTRLIFDQALTRRTLADELRRVYYPLVHLATHARFDAQSANSFIQLNGSRLGFAELEQLLRGFAAYPLDLLVLSACETAKGDQQRAALGFAGLAAKTGARSVIGSLWRVDDAAAARLMPLFYQHWPAGASKARALQLAQQVLLAHYEPQDWAAFVLIGRWQAGK